MSKKKKIEKESVKETKKKIESFNLKVCSVSKAIQLASKLMGEKKNFEIFFVDKKDESTHILSHNFDPPEFMTDEWGTKWKRVYTEGINI